EVAAVAAIEGRFADPRKYEKAPRVSMPKQFTIDDSMFIFPPKSGEKIEISRGPNIAPLPLRGAMEKEVHGSVLIKVGDNITTDHIMPAGKYLPLRSNVPEYAKHVFEGVDKEFYKRAMEKKGGFIVGGENYGQGSSREHAALCPMYLGVKVVLVKSFARIHLANLVNFGIVPLTFKNPGDYDKIQLGDDLALDVHGLDGELVVKNRTRGFDIHVTHTLTDLDRKMLLAGGQLPYVKQQAR
ncbi:MAG TPA: aconitate hydratase, partial [Candidatus Ozemobacteraceae bacterium]|nr:aconitate hydratase [Candidatus Ozemobacteraceae bacterium]